MSLRLSGLAIAVLVTAAYAQDKPPTWAQVMANMGKQKSYDFTMKGGPDGVDGTYEKGGVHYRAGGVEVAGKGGITHASTDGKWTSVSTLIQLGQGGETLKRISKLQPPHTIVPQVASFAKKVDGDGVQGFTGEFAQGNLSQLIRSPWLETEDLLACTGLTGRFAFSCSSGLIVKAEIQVQGNKVQWTKRHYVGVPAKDQPPPTPPGQNWKLGPDGYWYEGVEKNVSVTVTIEFKDYGTAKISDDVRGKIGMK